MRRLLPALLHGRRVSRRRVSTIGGEEGGRLKEVGVLVRIRWAAVQGANTDSAGVRVEDTEVLSEQCGCSRCCLLYEVVYLLCRWDVDVPYTTRWQDAPCALPFIPVGRHPSPVLHVVLDVSRTMEKSMTRVPFARRRTRTYILAFQYPVASSRDKKVLTSRHHEAPYSVSYVDSKGTHDLM